MPHAEQLPRLLLEHPDACCPGPHVSHAMAHAALVPKEEGVADAQAHGQNRALLLEEAAHVPMEA